MPGNSNTGAWSVWHTLGTCGNGAEELEGRRRIAADEQSSTCLRGGRWVEAARACMADDWGWGWALRPRDRDSTRLVQRLRRRSRQTRAGCRYTCTTVSPRSGAPRFWGACAVGHFGRPHRRACPPPPPLACLVSRDLRTMEARWILTLTVGGLMLRFR